MKYPILKEIPTTRDVLDKFKGYNHNLRIGEGEFYDMKNLTGDDYPVLSPRKKRGIYLTTKDPNGMCSNTDFCYVDGRYFYIGDTKHDLKLTAGNKELISMGTNVIVMPDQKYINTVKTSERGTLLNGIFDIPDAVIDSGLNPKVTLHFLVQNSSPDENGILFETVKNHKTGRGVFLGDLWPLYFPGDPNKDLRGSLGFGKVYNSDRTNALHIYREYYNQGSNTGWLETETSRQIPVALAFEDDDEAYFKSVIKSIKSSIDHTVQNGSGLLSYDGMGRSGTRIIPIKFKGLNNIVDTLEMVGVVTYNNEIVTQFNDVSGEETVVRRGIILAIGIGSESEEGRVYYDETLNTPDWIYSFPRTNYTEWLFGQKIPTKDDEYIVYENPVFETPFSITAPYNAESDVPIMDYIIESGNRLWGCRYGLNNAGEFVNEIYASALGDFKEWKKLDGPSTDSYIASVGTNGKFTGAINYNGQPIFFKEDCMHRVYGNYPAQYQIKTIYCKGVQEGCSKSLAVVNEILFYKSRSSICAYDGSSPIEISAPLGDVIYSNAVAGALRNKYYISMQDDTGAYHLFVYDTSKGMWHKEDNTQATQFCNHKGELYYIDYDDNYIHSIKGTGVQETEPIKWGAETGILGATTPDDKYVTRLDIRMSVAKGSKFSLHIEYDSMGEWERLMEIEGLTLNTFTIPIRPRRCDHFRLRLEGEGDAKIFSISKTMEEIG